MISTEFYPLGVQGTFEDASGWKNLPETDEPLDMSVKMHFKEGVDPVEDQVWHVLAWQSGDDGYDRITLAPKRTSPKPSLASG